MRVKVSRRSCPMAAGSWATWQRRTGGGDPRSMSTESAVIGPPASSRLAFVLSLLAAVACSVLGAPSRVRAGELYAPGSARYDAYFGEVHAQQIAATTWPNERRSARKPLLDALKLVPDADDATIAQSAKDRLSTGVLRLEVHGTDVHIVEATAAHHDNPNDVLTALEQAAHAE